MHWASLVVLYVVPFTTLAILNTLIYRQVRRANKGRQRLSPNGEEGDRTGYDAAWCWFSSW